MPTTPTKTDAPRRPRWTRRLWLVGGVLVGCVAVGAVLVGQRTGLWSPALIRAWLQRLGPWGPLVLIVGLAAILVVPIIPASVLQIGAGLAFGPRLGLIYVLLADVVGAAAGFGIARRWGQQFLLRFVPGTAEATANRLAGQMSWRAVLLLRLLPGPAYPLVSASAGLSRLRFWSYMLASFAGVLPSLALLVLAGDLVTRSPWLAFGVVALLVGSMAVLGRVIEGRRPKPEPFDAQQPEDSGS